MKLEEAVAAWRRESLTKCGRQQTKARKCKAINVINSRRNRSSSSRSRRSSRSRSSSTSRDVIIALPHNTKRGKQEKEKEAEGSSRSSSSWSSSKREKSNPKLAIVCARLSENLWACCEGCEEAKLKKSIYIFKPCPSTQTDHTENTPGTRRGDETRQESSQSI